MKRTALTLLALALPLLAGCGWNNAMTTTINYRHSSKQMVHIATVPHTRPDGSSTQEARKALLDQLRALGGTYTYAEDAAGYLLHMDDGSRLKERADILIVPGQPDVALFLRDVLFQEFGAKRPIVVTIPAASPAIVTVDVTRGRDRRPPTDGGDAH